MGMLSSPATIMVYDCVCAKALFIQATVTSMANRPMVTLTVSCFSKSIVRSKFIFKFWEFIAEVEYDLPVPFAVNTEIQTDIGDGQCIVKSDPRIRKIRAGKQARCIIGLDGSWGARRGHGILHRIDRRHAV